MLNKIFPKGEKWDFRPQVKIRLKISFGNIGKFIRKIFHG